MELRTAASPRDVKHYTTERLREEFLIEKVFYEDEIKLVYSHIDRIITGSATPVNKELKLEAGSELRAKYFLERREMGVINIGGDGIITVDGSEFIISHKNGMYIGMGKQDITFKAIDPANPPKFYINSAPWLPNRFHGKAVVEGQRKFMGTLWNTYAFYVLYAEIDQFDATKYALEYDKLSVMDKWLLSKLNTLVKTVDENLANYRIPESARALQDFVDDMSNWYVRRSRERFWAKGMEQDKINAYMTLYTALVTVAKVAAPMIPFMTEDIYQNLVRGLDANAPESIHLCDFPTYDASMVDAELEANMDEVLKLVVMGRACRNAANIKNRQPIGKMFVKSEVKLPEFYQEIVEEELNVKTLEFTDDVRAFTSYTFKPQLKTVGPKYGKLLGGIRGALDSLDGNAAMDEVNATGMLKLDINGQEVVLLKEDLLIDMAQMEGYVSENDNNITVVLDTNLTEELLEEGFVRELISKIQTMRKEADFEVTDKIQVSYVGTEKAEALFAKYADAIGGEVLATAVEKKAPTGYTKEWNINGEKVTLGVEK